MAFLRFCLVARLPDVSARQFRHRMPENDCLATPEIYPGTTLARLASFYYGDVSYQYAIMLATNARAGAGSFLSSATPSSFRPNPPSAPRFKLCVPELAEAEELRDRYDNYLEALADMAVAVPADVSHSLDRDPAWHLPVTVATWIRADQMKILSRRRSGSWVDALRRRHLGHGGAASAGLLRRLTRERTAATRTFSR